MSENEVKKVLIFNGSMRKDKTSYQFASTLKKITVEKGHHGDVLHIIDYFNQPESMETIKSKLDEMDLMVLVAPLYLDTLPYIDIWFLEQLQRHHGQSLTGKSLMVVSQCDFPDVTLNEPVFRTCRFFAEEMAMVWRGGLAYGGGAALDGKPIETLGGRGQKIRKGFEWAMKAVLADQMIPSEAQKVIELRVPSWCLGPLAVYLNYASRREGRRNGVFNLYSSPYRLK